MEAYVKGKNKILILLLLLSMILFSCTLDVNEELSNIEAMINETSTLVVDEEGVYSSKEEVALYLLTYEKLPNNFITKEKAEDLGWQSDQGNLWDVTDQMSIGGNKFGNREKLLPSKEGRVYYECDINYTGGYRNAERIVYSNDGLIFYTNDHYESFTQLYGEM